MVKQSVWVGLFLAFFSTIGACGGGNGSGSHAGSLTATCSGSYSCHGPDVELATELHKVGGKCYAGDAQLSPGGTVRWADGDTSDWHGDSDLFTICFDGTCVNCAADETGHASGSA